MQNQIFFNENNKENTDTQTIVKGIQKNMQNNENLAETKSQPLINISKMFDSDSE